MPEIASPNSNTTRDGTWAVVSVVNEEDGRKTEPYGANPKGQFIFTVDGYFSTNIIR